MPDAEKQEGQKTVVAFIAGLLIGGLLVWVFSSSPEETPVDETDGTSDTEMTEGNGDENTTSTENESASTGTLSDNEDSSSSNEGTGGEITVSDQPAGTSVSLDGTEFPTNEGWVAVRDYENNVPGRILGAARYNVSDGLTPDSVNLLRGTVADMDYQVVFFTENGDREFNLATDTEIEGTSAVFTAE